MNPGFKTLCLSSINQPRCLVVRYQANESQFSASWHFQAGHLPFPVPPGVILKRCPWPQCSQPHQQTLNLFRAEAALPWNSSHASWVKQEGCPAPPLLQTCRDLGQGRDLAACPSLHKGRQSRDVFLEGPENSSGSSQTAGQDEEILVVAIKRSQVLGWGARNPPTGQAGSEAAFHIRAVRTFLFICSSASAKKEGGAALFSPLPDLSSAPCNSRKFKIGDTSTSCSLLPPWNVWAHRQVLILFQMAWHDLTHVGKAEVTLSSAPLKSENSCFPSQAQISANYSMQNGVASTGRN